MHCKDAFSVSIKGTCVALYVSYQLLIATQGKQLQLRIPSLKGMTDREA